MDTWSKCWRYLGFVIGVILCLAWQSPPKTMVMRRGRLVHQQLADALPQTEFSGVYNGLCNMRSDPSLSRQNAIRRSFLVRSKEVEVVVWHSKCKCGNRCDEVIKRVIKSMVKIRTGDLGLGIRQSNLYYRGTRNTEAE